MYLKLILYVFNFFNIDIDEDVLGFEGMEKFCEDIGVELENVNILYW